MTNQTPSQIIKQEFRTIFQTDFYNRFSNLENNTDLDQNQITFGNLLAFDEEIIGPNQHINYTLDKDQTIIVLPIVGAINIKSKLFSGLIHTNELQTFLAKKQTTYTISNPYPHNVQWLQLRFKNIFEKNNNIAIEFETKNNLKTLIKNNQFLITIGIFDARQEAKYNLQNPKNGVFAFVLNGALEFQNRLLENRDSLKIWNIKTLDMEALANQTIILIIEVTFSQS